MRFFSNDARESTDEQAQDDRPERVQSDPVAVPNQRPPSPWSNAPSAADDTVRDDTVDDTDRELSDDTDRELSDDERRDGTVDDRDGSDRPPFHEPAAQPTAFGASTVGGAVAASAMANPEPDTAASGSTYASSTAGTDTRQDRDGHDGHDHGGPADDVDLPLDDKSSPSGTSADTSLDPDVVPSDSDTVSSDADADSRALKDEGGFDDPKAVDPATDKPLGTDDTPAADSAVDSSADSATPAVVPVPVAPVATASVVTVALFAADDAQSFRERWREVQLRFVDSPKDAAGDAAKLVDEAVDKLTAGLRAQRDGLASDTEDTEQLRVQLRGYRDVLNRILGL